tara:strand:+ start:243 stop:743 length:501 start_codon:yes stop_codon:yes gene_type:complete
MRLFVIFFFSFFLSISSNAANTKIGFIDTDQVLLNLSSYKESLRAISEEFEPKKQELLNLFEHIELVKSKINSINNSSSQKTLEAEISKLLTLEQSFKEETEFWQKTINNKKINLLKEIELIINRTINEYAIKENYDLILYENIAFVSDEVNITQEIIDEIEKLKL